MGELMNNEKILKDVYEIIDKSPEKKLSGLAENIKEKIYNCVLENKRNTVNPYSYEEYNFMECTKEYPNAGQKVLAIPWNRIKVAVKNIKIYFYILKIKEDNVVSVRVSLEDFLLILELLFNISFGFKEISLIDEEGNLSSVKAVGMDVKFKGLRRVKKIKKIFHLELVDDEYWNAKDAIFYPIKIGAGKQWKPEGLFR